MVDMNIICASDDKYAPYCGAMITSLLENNKNHSVTVYVLSSDMGELNRTKFEQLSSYYHQKINIVWVDSSEYSQLPLGNFSNITKEAYFRLSIPSLLKGVDKVLYLDCDMIVRHDLGELYETNLYNIAICGIQDCQSMIKNGPQRLGYDDSYSYFNSGMGLWNLDYMRSFDFEGKMKTFIQNESAKILYHDQDILNAVCYGRYKETSVRWNMLSCFLMQKPDISENRLADLNRWIENPGIIHYSAKYKPWNKECKHPYKAEFWKYVGLSPWADLKEERRFKGKDAMVVWAKLAAKRYLAMLGRKEYVYRELKLR